MIPFLNYIVWDPSPIAFRLGSFAVHYYAFCWMIGLGLGLLLMQKIYKQQGFKVEQAQSLFFYIFIGVLIGGRWGTAFSTNPTITSRPGTTWWRCSCLFATCRKAAGGSRAMRDLPATAA